MLLIVFVCTLSVNNSDVPMRIQYAKWIWSGWQCHFWRNERNIDGQGEKNSTHSKINRCFSGRKICIFSPEYIIKIPGPNWDMHTTTGICEWEWFGRDGLETNGKWKILVMKKEKKTTTKPKETKMMSYCFTQSNMFCQANHTNESWLSSLFHLSAAKIIHCLRH